MNEELRLSIIKTIDSQFGRHIFKILLNEEDMTILEDIKKGTFHIETEEIGVDEKVITIILKSGVKKRIMNDKNEFYNEEKYAHIR